MATLDQTFVINVLLATGGVSRRSFNKCLFIGSSQRRQSSAKEYTSYADVLTDYVATDPEAAAAQVFFSQSPKPRQLIIGTRYSKAVITVTTVTNNGVYSVDINGVTYPITADSDATEAEILTALSAVINPAAGIASSVVSSTIEVTEDASKPFKFANLSSNLAISFTPVATLSTAFTNVRAANDTWYAVATAYGAKADAVAIAALVAALPNRLYYFQSSDADIRTAATDDVASTIKGTLNQRAVGLYRLTSANQNAAAGYMGAANVLDPGVATHKFISIAGITPDVLGSTTYLDAKNMNYYTELSSGTPIVQPGKSLGGEFTDIIRDTDYVSINLRDDLLAAFVNNPKVPYNARGLALVENVVRSRMQDAFAREIFDPDDTTYTFPTMADTLAADRAARILRGIEINTRAVGAIHFVDGITMNVGA
ncbi:MAG: DUF3383 domain-containing protein [Rhodobacteraceae bacterium]|nr:DUF3383 domain-containing protein [Paracoccaceae bacterium]